MRVRRGDRVLAWNVPYSSVRRQSLIPFYRISTFEFRLRVGIYEWLYESKTASPCVADRKEAGATPTEFVGRSAAGHGG